MVDNEEKNTKRSAPEGLTKKELIEKLAEQLEDSKKNAELMINTLRSILISEVQVGHKFVLNGIGTFVKIQKPSRVAINPATGQKIQIPAKNVIKFKPAKNLKEAVGLTE